MGPVPDISHSMFTGRFIKPGQLGDQPSTSSSIARQIWRRAPWL
jgi:hypothetical protein